VRAEDGSQPPRFQLIAQLDLSGGTTRNSDITGWIDPVTNKEYAIVGEWQGRNVYIIDVSNAQNPVLVSTINPARGFDVKTWDNYLYCVDGDGTFVDGKIFDISNPASPVPAGTFQSAHNITLHEGYMYKSIEGLTIYDLATPTSPQQVWFDFRPGGHDATVQNNILYDFHGRAGTFIYDVSNKASPVLLGGVEHPNDLGIAYHHNGWPTADGKHLFITDEIGTSVMPDIIVVDISNPSNMGKVGQYSDPNATIHNVMVVGDLLFASYYVAGVRVFDITRPWDPILLDTYDTAPAYTGNNIFEGCWGIYPFAPSGVIYASDMQNGLYLFTYPGLPVAVTITSFDASYSDLSVRLRWEIGLADELQGFRIYRSEQEESGYLSITPSLLPAQGEYAYTDRDIRAGTTYWYRLGAFDRDGEFLSQTQKVMVPELSLSLDQNFPNPFNPSTTIGYQLPEAGFVSLAVYNGMGQRVRALVAEEQPAGPQSAIWNGANDAGVAVASGVYFYRLEVAGEVMTKRMILLK
jgi:choice-of-anchor B domain-containing protein